MLKIKDNIDLQELEKYDYRLMNDLWNKLIYWKHVDFYTSIEIDFDSRIIYENYDDMYREVEEKYIYDLIKADLVEKVE